MMNQLIERFPAQLLEALKIGENASIKKHSETINNIYVAGLGGSGIGANFVQSFIKNECKIPFNVGKGYSIPNYIGKHTLAIISSYSGNTEETLEAMSHIIKTGAKIVCLSSGGKLIEIAKANNFDFIQVPGNWPSPRACLGYSLVQQLWILHKLDLISDLPLKQVKKSIDLLKFNSEFIHSKAEEIAQFINGKIPIIYSTDRLEPATVRLRQQINENAKMLCWHHLLPEMNHNELVGWRTKNDNLAVLYLRNDDDYRRNQVRMDINQKIIKKYTPHIMEVYSKGSSLIEKTMYFVNLGDWTSWYASQLRGVDAIEIKVIDFLKNELSKV